MAGGSVVELREVGSGPSTAGLVALAAAETAQATQVGWGLGGALGGEAA